MKFIKDFENNIQILETNEKIRLRNLVVNQLNKFSNYKFRLTNEEKLLNNLCRRASCFLKNNQDILLTRADKDNTTVAIDKNVYMTRMCELLSDCDTYSIIAKNPVKKIETCVNDMTKRWLKQQYIEPKEYVL